MSNFSLMFPITIKKDDEGTPDVITLEGYASFKGKGSNTYIDRANEIVEVDGIDIKDYKNNPVVLLNHDRNDPIGTCIKTEKRPEGLYVTCEIHKEACDEKTFYRIQKGIIKSFSIGFRTVQGEWKTVGKNEVYYILKSILAEISCVTIPCNAQSTYMVMKSLDDEDSVDLNDMNMSEEEVTVKIKLKELLTESSISEMKEKGLESVLEEERDMDIKEFIKMVVKQEIENVKIVEEVKEDIIEEAKEKIVEEVKEDIIEEAKEEIPTEFVDALKSLIESVNK